MPTDLDFKAPRSVPRPWINNGFQGWTGRVALITPSTAQSIRLETDARYYRLYVAGHRADTFCFGPMSHAAGDHHRPGYGGLRQLAPGEAMGLALTLTPLSLP